MKIKSMTASFGGLERARLEPGPGLTLITAPNEGGKSTWAAFWRTMLYGIDTRDRDRKGRLADKNRYQPWSGRPMEGELTLEWGGRDITIRRGPRGSTPFGTFSAVYTGTEEPVPALTSAACGELLTGVGQDTFTRSAFLGAGDLAVTTTPELERRIAALASSGQEDVSFSQAQACLRDWRNKRRVNRSVGEIPRLEGELALAEGQLAQLDEVTAELAGLEEERNELERRQTFLLQRQEAHRRRARKELSARYTRAREEYETAQNQLSALEREQARFGVLPDREELKRAQGELQYLKVLDEEIKQGSSALEEAEVSTAKAKESAKDEHFPGLTGEEAAAKAEAECVSCRSAQTEVERIGKLFQRFLLVIAASAAGGILARLLWPRPASDAVLLGTLTGAAILALGVCLWAFFQRRRQGALAREILDRYGVQTPEELTALAQDYRERCQAAEKAAHEEEVIRNAVTQRLEKQDATKTQLLDFVHTFAPEVTDLFGCSAALSRSLNLEHELALARERTEERRRRLDDLVAQGAGELSPEDREDASTPEGTLEETVRALSLVRRELERVNARRNQAMGLQQAIGDPAALAARCEVLEEELSRRQLEHAALELAADVLTQANARLQERFSPALNQLTGQYLSRLTGGRYTAVSLSRELEGAVQTGPEILPRSALSLSRGTADQLYLALRLAVCRLCLPEKPPIFLDDALAAFDDRRLALALDLLLELAGEQQVLLFSCHQREAELLADRAEVTRIDLPCAPLPLKI